ncbi:MAG: hypothetical protein ACLFWB_02360 [Armatimonadota bacterium]
MHEIEPCKPYTARPAGTSMYRLGDHAFKVYYVDITGRDDPERYEWDECGRDRTEVIDSLTAAEIEGVGFVVAFPHITKVFRYAPSAEILQHVRAFDTADFSEIDLRREDGYLEFACYAEAIIATAEYRLWADAGSVKEYLAQWTEWEMAAIADNEKLARYYAGDDA